MPERRYFLDRTYFEPFVPEHSERHPLSRYLAHQGIWDILRLRFRPLPRQPPKEELDALSDELRGVLDLVRGAEPTAEQWAEALDRMRVWNARRREVERRGYGG